MNACLVRRGAWHRRVCGFTLIELLVVVAVIALLIGLLVPTLARAREATKRVLCLANLRTIAAASFAYSSDSSVDALIPTLGSGNDDLAYLYPAYFGEHEAAVCPSTQNVVDETLVMNFFNSAFIPNDRFSGAGLRRAVIYAVHNRPVLLHLTALARGRDDDGSAPPPGTDPLDYNKGGHSYEIDAWKNEAVWPDGVATIGQRERNIQRGWDEPDELYGALFLEFNPDEEWETLKRATNIRDPSQNRILGDGDPGKVIRPTNGTAGAIINVAEGTVNNYPDEFDNHGASGLNVGMCDGSARWLSTGEEVVRTYLRSRRSPLTISDPSVLSAVMPQLQIDTEFRGGRNVTRYSLPEY